MTLSFSLSADAEAKLRDWARASGLSPDDFARRLIEQAVSSINKADGTHPNGDAAKRVANFHAWAGSIKSTSRTVDDSRDSMYLGRGE